MKAEVYQLQEDSVAYKISWLQCDSDSKLLHYRLVLYESQYDTELEHLTGEAKREMILSATEHHVVLKNLNFHSTYHLELSCKVEIEDSAVYRDEATLTFKTPPLPPLFVRTKSQSTTEMSELAMLKYVNTGGNPALVKSIHIENPHFNEGSLRAMVYWTLSLNSSDENHTVKGTYTYE